MAAPKERNLAELGKELGKQLDLIQTHTLQATGQFMAAAETYVQSMAAGVEQTRMLLAEYVDLQQSFEVDNSQAYSGPYVAVLLDGHNTYFKSNWIRDQDNGGAMAAQALSASVTKYISELATIPENIRIVVRIYADLQALTESAKKIGLVDKKNGRTQGLTSFASRFSQASPFFDFTNVGDKHVVKIKISENFKIYSQDPQCKLILFGVSMSMAYIDMLASYSGPYGKLVLFPCGTLHSEYRKLDLNFTKFEGVFRFTDFTYGASNPGVARDSMSTRMRRTIPKSNDIQSPKNENRCFELANKDVCTRSRCTFDHSPGGKGPITQIKPGKPTDNPYGLPEIPRSGIIPVNEEGWQQSGWAPDAVPTKPPSFKENQSQARHQENTPTQAFTPNKAFTPSKMSVPALKPRKTPHPNMSAPMEQNILNWLQSQTTTPLDTPERNMFAPMEQNTPARNRAHTSETPTIVHDLIDLSED